MKIDWIVINKNCWFIYKYLEFDSSLIIILLYKFYNCKLLFLQLKWYIFSLQIESDDSFTVSDIEYLCKKSEPSRSSKCIENSSAPKAKKLKFENKFPRIGWSHNLNNITHTRNTPFTSNTGSTDLFDDCTTEADFFLKKLYQRYDKLHCRINKWICDTKKIFIYYFFLWNTLFARVHYLYGYIFTSRCYNILVEGFGI